MVTMWHFMILFFPAFINCYRFDYPIKGFERADPINLQIFLPCLKGVFDEEYGYFEPLYFVLYPLSLPPIAACPQLSSKETVRCLAIRSKSPDRFVPCGEIEPKSRVCIHAFLTEYDETFNILITSTCLKKYDWVVVIDWARTANPRVFGRVRIPFVNEYLALTNTILNGRIICNLVKYLVKVKKVSAEDIFTVGFSGETQFLSPMSSFCREKYDIRFNHMVAIELPFIPYRRSNYPLVNRTSAKFVDVIFTTKSPNIPVVDSLLFLSRLGYFEVDADCVYYANPENFVLEQEPCLTMPGTPCSHAFAVGVFTAAYSDRCLYRFGPCPDEIIQLASNREVGLTRLNCADHPFLKRTCIHTTSNPLLSC